MIKAGIIYPQLVSNSTWNSVTLASIPNNYKIVRVGVFSRVNWTIDGVTEFYNLFQNNPSVGYIIGNKNAALEIVFGLKQNNVLYEQIEPQARVADESIVNYAGNFIIFNKNLTSPLAINWFDYPNKEITNGNYDINIIISTYNIVPSIGGSGGLGYYIEYVPINFSERPPYMYIYSQDSIYTKNSVCAMTVNSTNRVKIYKFKLSDYNYNFNSLPVEISNYGTNSDMSIILTNLHTRNEPRNITLLFGVYINNAGEESTSYVKQITTYPLPTFSSGEIINVADLTPLEYAIRAGYAEFKFENYSITLPTKGNIILNTDLSDMINYYNKIPNVTLVSIPNKNTTITTILKTMSDSLWERIPSKYPLIDQ